MKINFRNFIMNEVASKTSNGETVFHDKDGLIPGLPNAFDSTEAVGYIENGEYLLAALSIVSVIKEIAESMNSSSGNVDGWVRKNLNGSGKNLLNYTPSIEKVRYAVERYDTANPGENPGSIENIINTLSESINQINSAKEHVKGALANFVIKNVTNKEEMQRKQKSQESLSESLKHFVYRNPIS